MTVRTPCLALILTLAMSGPATAKPQSGFAPSIPKLTAKSVNKIIKALPGIASKTASYQSSFFGGLSADKPASMTAEQIAEMQAVFEAHGFGFEEFVMQMSTLLSTYIAVDPGAIDRLLPTEQSPEIRKILDDPDVPEARKKAVKKQLTYLAENKPKLRKQFAQSTNEANKKLVKSMLRKVRRAFDAARAAAAKASAKTAEK